MCSWTYRLRKKLLDKRLKSPVWEDPSTSNMVDGLKHCTKLNDITFSIETIQVEKVSLSDMQILRTFCYPIDCQ